MRHTHHPDLSGLHPADCCCISPSWHQPMVVALHLDIIGMVFLIHCQNIQPHRTTLQILQIMLTMDFLYSQVITVQNDLKQAFRTGLSSKTLLIKSSSMSRKFRIRCKSSLCLRSKSSSFCVSTSAIGSPAFCSLSKVRIP